MADKNQKIIDQAIDQEYKYGFTTDIEQTKFEPGPVSYTHLTLPTTR